MKLASFERAVPLAGSLVTALMLASLPRHRRRNAAVALGRSGSHWPGKPNNIQRSAGSSSTANFTSNLVKTLPPLHEIAKMAGVELPEYLGKATPDASQST